MKKLIINKILKYGKNRVKVLKFYWKIYLVYREKWDEYTLGLDYSNTFWVKWDILKEIYVFKFIPAIFVFLISCFCFSSSNPQNDNNRRDPWFWAIKTLYWTLDRHNHFYYFTCFQTSDTKSLKTVIVWYFKR